MKHYLIILSSVLCLCGIQTVAQNRSYASHSSLKNGKIVKVQISETGIYRLTYEDLKAQGLNPANVRVLGYGGAPLSQNFMDKYIDDVPSCYFYMSKGADNVFNEGDFILFYAQGPIRWSYTNNSWQHTRNPYSNYGYYFLSDAAGEQLLIEDEPDTLNTTNPNQVYSGDRYGLHEQDLVNLLDVSSGREGGGREWYGEELSINTNNYFQKIRLPHILANEYLQCRVDIAVRSAAYSTVYMSIGDQSRQTMTAGIDVTDNYTKGTIGTIRLLTAHADSEIPQVSIRIDNNANAKAWLNYIEMVGRCSLTMDAEPMYICNPSCLASAGSIFDEPKQNNIYHILRANTTTQVWNITDRQHIRRMPTYWKQDTLCFVGRNDKLEEYIAINPYSESGTFRPDSLWQIPNQDLHRLRNIDLVIITPTHLLEPAKALAQAHEEHDGIVADVVTDQQVYNEFSSGTPDATAYRALMKMLWDRSLTDSTCQAPKNLLLFGDGSFDNRHILSTSGTPPLLTYQAENSTIETKAYATDDYFGMMDDNDALIGDYFYDSRGTMEIGVGRLPVHTTDDAWGVVNKLKTYMRNTNLGRWKQQLCFLADDGDGGLHTRVGDAAGEQVRIDNPDFITNKIYLDSYVQETTASGESYPIAYNQFQNLLQNGVMLMDYSGHGSANNICSEMFLTIADVKRMSNQNQGFWMLATCNFAHFDQHETSSAEEAVLNPNGGAIGVLSACRTVYASQNDIINRNVCDIIFTHTDAFTYPYTLGEAISRAKNKTGTDDNKLPYIFLGDPALKLNFPTQYEVITLTELDTLHALDCQTVKGFIRDANGDTATYFNGAVSITIYDKMQVVSTRDNDQTDPAKKHIDTFNDYPNILFRGEADVVDGKFEYTFMLPKDIHYNYGNGRIVYYAWDEEVGEGIGHHEDFVIGGSSTLENNDTKGPDITMYLNTPAFTNGGTTYERPHFYATLYDEYGINTIGSGIGHDLMMMIDDDSKQSYILNDYFTATRGTFREGKVSFLMSELPEGHHSLWFRAWDLNNNSNRCTLNFEVIKGLQPQIYNLIVYPNPVHVGDNVHFAIDYDQQDETIFYELRIYDLLGHLVHSSSGTLSGTLTVPVGDNGMTTGSYIYQIQIHSASSSVTAKAGRLIVY